MEKPVINLDQFLKKIDNEINTVYSYGDKSWVSVKDMSKKLNDKMQLAELAYKLFDELVDCREIIRSLRSNCIDSKTIISKLTSIEKTVKEYSPTIIEAEKKYTDTVNMIQKEIKKQNTELQNNVKKDIKSYSDALHKNVKKKTPNTVITNHYRSVWCR